MSLGTPVRDSYKTDPFVLRPAVQSTPESSLSHPPEIDGKDLYGNKLYGTIGSPGIEPSVITVGAANTLGTDIRSSTIPLPHIVREARHGAIKPINGVRKYDNLIKPDLVASGNKIIAEHANPNSTLVTLLSVLRTGNG